MIMVSFCHFNGFGRNSAALSLDPDKIPGAGVYAAPVEQDDIFDCLITEGNTVFSNGPFVVQKDSIEKVYYVDPVQFVRDNSFSVTDYEYGLYRSEVWLADLYFKDGSFAFTASVFTKPDIPEFQTPEYEEKEYLLGYWGTMSLTYQKRFFPEVAGFGALPVNYANYAELIMERLGRDSFVPENCVRLVVIVRLYRPQLAFYVNDGTTEGFFVIGDEINLNDSHFQQPYYQDYPENLPKGGLSEFIDMDRFAEIAKEIARKYEEWEKTVQNQIGGRSAGMPEDVSFGEFSGIEKIRYVENTREYLAANTKVQSALPAKAKEGSEALTPVTAKATPWQAWIGVGAAAALALAAGIVLARRKNET